MAYLAYYHILTRRQLQYILSQEVYLYNVLILISFEWLWYVVRTLKTVITISIQIVCLN